jgi:hypothetical protein
MLLKFLIVVLLLGLLVSLGSGFYFLMMDQGDANKRRLFHSLGVRVTLATTLMLLIIYGVSSGKLRSRAPWEQSPVVPAAAVPEEAAATDRQE